MVLGLLQDAHKRDYKQKCYQASIGTDKIGCDETTVSLISKYKSFLSSFILGRGGGNRV